MGHDVLVSTPEPGRAAVIEAGFAHVAAGFPSPEAMAAVMARIDEAQGDAVPAVIARDAFVDGLARHAAPGLVATMREWNPDIVLRDSFEFGALVAAEAAGLPCARVTVHSTRHEAGMSRHVIGPLDDLREAHGLARDGGEAMRRERTFTSFPASLDGSGAEAGWQDPFRSWDRPSPPSAGKARPGWAPEAGEDFVYVTLGTVSGRSDKARAAYRAAVEAVGSLPVRALLTTGPVMDPEALGAVPTNVTVEAFVPQDEVLPFATTVLCHGGSGTLLGALARGVPVVVAPLFADQPTNARSVMAAGAGLAVPEITPGDLRNALQAVLDQPAFREGARRVAAEIDGLATPDQAIEVLLAPLGKTGR